MLQYVYYTTFRYVYYMNSNICIKYHNIEYNNICIISCFNILCYGGWNEDTLEVKG